MQVPLSIRPARYGWIPDLPDQRDYAYSLLLGKPTPPLPAVDLRSQCTPVEDQGELGCCTACALVGNLEYLKEKQVQRTDNFSKLFLYYNERVIRKTTGTDSGASLRDGIKTLVKVGDCLESLCPYDISQFTTTPSREAYADAANHQITRYYRLSSLMDMHNTLSSGYPFVFGFAVYESFESETVAKTGIVPLPTPTEHLLGGHAVLAVGYDDDQACLIVRNSWGSAWGDQGYFYMPYDYVTNSKLASDFWTIRDME